MRTTRSDAVVFLMTLKWHDFPSDTAIYIGVGTSIVLFLKKVARPEMVEYAFNDEGRSRRPATRSTRYPGSFHRARGRRAFLWCRALRDQIRRICEDPNLKIVVLKMRNAHNMDATGVMALDELVHHMNERGRYLTLSEAKEIRSEF